MLYLCCIKYPWMFFSVLHGGGQFSEEVREWKKKGAGSAGEYGTKENFVFWISGYCEVKGNVKADIWSTKDIARFSASFYLR